MASDDAHLDLRRGAHAAMSRRIARLDDDQIAALLATGRWRDSVHGSRSGVVELDGARLFVKQLSLTALEAARPGDTANVFDLPLFYQYGVGSAGFGAWRELQAALRASAWAAEGECPHFQLVHHWRITPRTAPTLVPRQVEWLSKAVAYWDGSPAVAARLDAIAAAPQCIAVFMEHAPFSLESWLRHTIEQGTLGAQADAILDFADQLHTVSAFMNARGMLHFDLNADNILTDGQRIFAADFGLTICDDFDLSPDERAFYAAHRDYDRAYLPWALVEWLTPDKDPPALPPALTALVDHCRPVARVFDRFITGLIETSKHTSFPTAELEAALGVAV